MSSRGTPSWWDVLDFRDNHFGDRSSRISSWEVINRESIARHNIQGDGEQKQNGNYFRVILGFFIVIIYTFLFAGGILLIYESISDLIISSNHPVGSIKYKEVDQYEAPGIAIFPNSHLFTACEVSYNNIAGSVVTLGEVNLSGSNCTKTRITYWDNIKNMLREVYVFKGPTDANNIEALFLHFKANDAVLHFYTVSYYIFPRYQDLLDASSPEDFMKGLHGYYPTFALSANLRMWMKMSLKEVLPLGHSKAKTEFSVEKSVVQFFVPQFNKPLFFLFFEWKSNRIEQYTEVEAVTIWRVIASLCGVFLVMYKAAGLSMLIRERVKHVKQEMDEVKKRNANREDEKL